MVFVMESEYSKIPGFCEVYLVSGHINLYEKYGFIKIGSETGTLESEHNGKIYMYKV